MFNRILIICGAGFIIGSYIYMNRDVTLGEFFSNVIYAVLGVGIFVLIIIGSGLLKAKSKYKKCRSLNRDFCKNDKYCYGCTDYRA